MSFINQKQYEEIISWFQEDGKLMSLGCIPRESQQLMVDYVTSTLDSELPLICEAPTGVGKTFSYLFPLAAVIADSKRAGTPLTAIISTSTKGLQRQLKSKDFPALAKLFPGLNTHIWMGANNYLCGVRLRKALSGKLEPEVRDELERLNQIYGQLRTMPNGWREELPFEIQDATWEKISGDTPCCQEVELESGEYFCKKSEAYKAAKTADILCVNHSLLCTLGLYMGRLHPNPAKTPENTFLVVDEAHDLEENLRRCLNFDFGITSLRKVAKKIVNAEAENHFQEQLSQVRESLLDCLNDDPIVVTSPTDTIVKPLSGLVATMEQLSTALVSQSKKGQTTGVNLSEEDIKEIEAKANQIKDRASALRSFLREPKEDCMLEVSKTISPKGGEPTIQLCPFQLEEQLVALWGLAKVKILTSATIFNASEVETKELYHLPEAITTVIPPNFNYGEMIKAYAIQNGENKALENNDLVLWIKAAIEMSAGNALVLFTSYASMNEVYSQLRDWAAQRKYNLLLQSRKSSPQQLIDSMASIPNTILFGTNTFWTGVDIKGTHLSNVIVTKLPFRMPDNYVKKYSDYLKSKGINAFFQWAVPDMINKTRQGIGRLIRDEEDRGLLFMLDPRFLATKYGQKLQRLIYPDIDGRSTITWETVQSPGDLEATQALLDWLKVEEPSDDASTTSFEDIEDEDVPF